MTEQNALKHGTKCLQASGWPTGEKPSLIIAIRGQDDRSYWLVALARHDALLGDLDRLIRDVWMGYYHEYPGRFAIEEVLYESDGEELTDAMKVPLLELVSPGSTFTYDYDFAPITSLDLKVLGETPVAPPGGSICLIARNKPPVIPCGICGDEADFVLSTFDDEIPLYYCQKCLQSTDHDPDYVDPIANSPRDGVFGYAEDPDAALPWYPPGWRADEIAPEEPDEDTSDDETKMAASVATVMGEFGPDINAFVEAEMAAYGEDGARMAGNTVIAFCTFMNAFYGLKIDVWDARSVQKCLVEHMSENPVFPKAWLESAVPILCRFLAHMEASGHMTDASKLAAALKKSEPAFQRAAVSPEKIQALFRGILKKAVNSGIDIGDIGAVFAFTSEELGKLSGLDPDNEIIQKEIANLFVNRMLNLGNDELHNAMIYNRCEDFCSQFEDDAILERCREIIMELSNHPAVPFSRGDEVLWSAAVVYAACQDQGLIRRGKGSPSLARDIGLFFGLELSSIRNKVRAMRAFLPD